MWTNSKLNSVYSFYIKIFWHIAGALKPEEVAELLDVDQIEEKRKCHVEGVSAFTSKGLAKAFYKLGKYVKKSKK